MSMKRFFFFLSGLILLSQSAHAQQKVFNWATEGQEQVRLQPGMYYAVGPFAFRPDILHPGTIKLALHTAKPVFIGVVPEAAWNYVVQNPQTVLQLQYFCLKENVLQIDYSCEGLNTFDSPFVVIIHDLTDPNAQLGRAILLGGLGLYAHSKKLIEQAAAEGVKEKFPIMRVTKSYGPFTPERNGDVIKISLNSPVPMAFAAVSPDEAANLRMNPEGFNSAIAKSRCQQRAAQKMNITCTLSLA